jgi:hypothetical protein
LPWIHGQLLRAEVFAAIRNPVLVIAFAMHLCYVVCRKG